MKISKGTPAARSVGSSSRFTRQSLGAPMPGACDHGSSLSWFISIRSGALRSVARITTSSSKRTGASSCSTSGTSGGRSAGGAASVGTASDQATAIVERVFTHGK